MSRSRWWQAVAAALAVGMLAGCGAGGVPGPNPAPGPSDGATTQLTELDPASKSYLWQQDVVAARSEFDALLANNDLPLLFTDEDGWEAWWSDLPEDLRDESLQTPNPEFASEVLVIANFGSCPPQSLTFATDGAGQIAYDLVTSESSGDGQMNCAWSPQAVYAYEFSLDDLGVDSVDGVTVSPQ